jgi:hypothetical protein
LLPTFSTQLSIIRPSVVALSSGSRLSAPAGEVPAWIVSEAAELRVFVEDEVLTLRLQPKARNGSSNGSKARDASNDFISRQIPPLKSS